MRKLNVLQNVSRGFHKVGFQVKKHSPVILVGAGIVGVVASTVMACKATTKAGIILENHNKKVEDIHECAEEHKNDGTYTEQDIKKDLTIVYTQTGLWFVKLYAPAATLGALSIVSILASHRILSKRNAAISAAYAVVDRGFKNYRKNVKERFGDRVDYELKHNIKAEQIKTIDIDENGNQVESTKNVDVSFTPDNMEYSDYARFFDEANPNWTKDPEYNLTFLKMQQNWANQRLQQQGYLFLNDVYDALGIDRSKAGQVVGWIYDPSDENRDNFVDFGIYDIHKARARAFVNGYERNILLDFNPDGVILGQLK